MERASAFRWALSLPKSIRNWFCHFLIAKRCRQFAYAEPEIDGRADRIGINCPGCICENVSVGRFGSPGRIRNDENLHSILIAPVDLDNDQIAMTLITHAERKGMSLMRDASTNQEFAKIIEARIGRGSNRTFHGVSSLKFCVVKDLISPTDTDHRVRGERLYSVLDADMSGLPHHAEIFSTVPTKTGTKNIKAAHRIDRPQLLKALSKAFAPASRFRGGEFVNYTTAVERAPNVSDARQTQ